MGAPPAVLPRSLAVLWAAFWLFFFVAESLAWDTPAAVTAAWTSLGLSFVLVALVACRAERAGGLLLVAIGLVAGLAYATWSPPNLSAATRVLTTATLSVPPIVAGTLFLVRARAVAGRARAAAIDRMRTPPGRS